MEKILKDIKIVSQDHFGRGIAKQDNKIIFVNNALPGEICDIKIVKNKKKYDEADVVNLKKSLSDLIKCQYYKECGGCSLLRLNYEKQLVYKENKLREILSKFANIDIELSPIIASEEFGYRNKIILHNLGLYSRNSHEIVKIEGCLLVHPEINKIIERLQVFSNDFGYNLETIMIRYGNCNERLLSIIGNIDADILSRCFYDLDVIILNGNILTKKNYICDELFGKKFQLSEQSFYQVNRFITEKLYGIVLEYLKNKGFDTVLDLYCGVGTISILMSSYVNKVIGLEVIADAIENARCNALLNNVDNVEFILGKVEDYIENFKNIDAIVVDPPRAGLDTKTISNILKLLPSTLIYVSCDPVTLARDLKVLMEKYEVVSITPVDMFPNTYHVESVSLLQRKSI